MGSQKSKTVKLLLEEGTLKGVMSIVDSSWNPGEMYSAPKESLEALLSTDACKKFGVYLLLSEDKVYVGQSMDLAKRVSQHVANKKWWDRVIILTTADDSLNRADIDYLEYYLIQKAQSSNRLDSENKKKGNMPKVDKFRKPELEQYLDEALFLMELIGITVFSDKKHGEEKKRKLAKAFVESEKDESIYYLERNPGDKARSTMAKMIIKNGKFVVLKGSKAALEPTPSCPKEVREKRKKDKVVDLNGILTKDLEFDSPSGASRFMLYASSNGKLDWKLKSGERLGNIIELNLD